MAFNFQDVLRDVHDPGLHSLKTTASLSASTVYVGNPTLYAVVNTGAAGDSTANIGFATVSISNPTLYAVVNTSAPGVSNSIVTVANPNFGVIGNVTLSDSKTYIGLTTTTIGSMPSVLTSGQFFPAPQSVASGALSPLSVDATGGLILANANKYIGLTSVSGTVGLGTGTLNIGSVSVLGGTINAGLNAGVNNIGFATVTQVNQPALVASTANIGSVSVLGGTINSILQSSTLNVGSVSILGGGIGINTGLNNIGFATVAVSTPTLFAVVNTSAAGVGNSIVTVANPNFGLNAGVNNIGFASVTPVAAWPDPKTYIGLVTVGHTVTVAAHALTASTVNIGSVSVLGGGIGLNAGINGIGFSTVFNAAGAAFIGLATVVPAFKALSTVHTGIISATGTTTIFVAPASNRFFVKNIHLSSLGRAEVEIRSGATTLIPFTALATTSGFAMNYGEEGLPSRAQADGFVVNLNGSATVGIMVNWYASP